MDELGDLNSIIAPVFNTASSTNGTNDSTPTTLSQQEFFSIMISELTNQDPLEPQDNNDFLNQVAQLQNLETMDRLTQGIEGLLLSQQITSGSSLIGQTVSAVDDNGLEVGGTVDRVVVQGQDVSVGVGPNVIPLSRVVEIQA